MSKTTSEPAVVDFDAHRRSFEQPRSRFPWGCLLGGCLVTTLLMVVGMVAVGVSSYRFYKKQVAQYTSEVPRELPIVEVSQEELEEIETRVEEFQEKVEKGETPEQLILTADDLNALISQDEKLRGRVFVRIEEGMVQAEVSIPTDAIPGAKGRFFNGSVMVDASLEDGVLIVTLQSAEVNGQPVPENIMTEIRKQNLAKDLYQDAEVAKKLRTFESLEIEEDRIVLTPKVESDEQSREPDSSEPVAPDSPEPL